MKKLTPISLVLLLNSGLTYSQWNANTAVNTSVCIQPNDQQDARVVTDGNGGAILSWLDFRNDVSQLAGDIYVQRLDKNGISKWTLNGVSLCNLSTDQTAPSMAEDGNGGAIIAWNDWRNGNRDIYAQKVDSSGTVQWTADGVAVAVKANHQQDAKLISDGAGGAIIVWQDSISGPYDIYAQRISNTGALLWTAGGVAICTAVLTQVNPRIETDGTGGAIITWQDKRNGVDYDIYAQRINASGAVQWTANGTPVSVVTGTQSNPKIEPDGSGGAIIAWQDKRNGVDYNVFAQRISSAGAVQWTPNGVAVCTAANSQSAIDMTSEGISGAVLSWKDLRSGNYDVYAQKVDLAGAVQWAANGIAISSGTAPQYNPNAVGDGSGGAILVWQDSTSGNWDVKSQRIDGSGNVLWTAGGVSVGTAADSQTSPKSVSDGSGGCVYVWQDKRNILDNDIYAHHLYSNGTTNGIQEGSVSVSSSCFPNPFSSSAVIEWKDLNPKGALSFHVNNILGQQEELPFTISQNKITVSRGGLAGGIYFFDIRQDNSVISKGKFIITD